MTDREIGKQRPGQAESVASDTLGGLEHRRQVRERLNDALGGGAIGTWIWDLATRHFIVDEYLAKLLWLDPQLAFQSLPFKTVVQRIYQKDRALFTRAIANQIKSVGYLELEFRIQQPDGEFCWLQSRCTPELDDTHQVVALRGAVIDITARKKADEQLRTSALLLKTSQSIAGLGGWELDVESGQIYWTAESYRILETTPEEHDPSLNMNLKNFQPASRGLMASAMEAALKHGESFDHELRMVTRKGRPIIVHLTGVVTMIDGKPAKVTGIIRDITARILADEERERHAAIVESSDDGIIGRTLSGLVTTWNPGAERLFGYKAAEIIGEPIAKLFPVDLLEEEDLILDRLASGEATGHFETRRITKDGREIDVSVAISAVRNTKGEVIGASKIVRDITDRKQAESRNRENQLLLQLAVTATRIGPWDWNVVTNEVFLSDEFKAQLGYGPDELEHTFDAFEIRLHPEDHDRVMQELQAAVADSVDNYTIEFRLRHKDGSYRNMRTYGVSMKNDRGEAIRMLGAHVDLTDIRQAEQKALRSQRLESMGTLAGGVAHDLNNALAPILLSLELLREKYPDDRGLVDLVEASAARCAEMVKQLLAIPRGQVAAWVHVQAAELIEELGSLMRGSFPKNIDLQVRCETDLPIVLGDTTQLHQVLLNLCVNARDAMPDGGVLHLSACQVTLDADHASMRDGQPGSYVVIKVQDEGMGIAAETIDHIFDPFFTTKDPHKGTGLGLSTVMGIVKDHGGFLTVDSTPGQGARFEVYLPVAGSRPSRTTTVPAVSTFRGQGETLLFIDDEPSIREMMELGLARLNFKPVLAANGMEGLAKVEEHKAVLSAVITDLHMPTMDGLAFVRAMRRVLPDIPVMVASGRMDAEVSTQLKALGVEVFLDKPFDQKKLRAVLEAMLKPSD